MVATPWAGAALPLALLATTATAFAQETPAQRDARLQWWREARFGMFVHWGLYSGLAGTWDGKPVATKGGMEWIQQRVKADTDTYARRAIPLFKPTPGFAREWARLAKGAGCRYLVFTSKHHDGFALHDSKVSDYDAGSVLQRDLAKEIAAAARAEGLRVGFYHSVIDWHHDQYAYAKSKILPHPLKGQPYPNGERDHSKYLDYLHAQVTELVSNYGKIDILWWDYSGVDWETCMTLNTTWGYSAHDHAWKSDETLIRNLVDIASKGGNYLLNIGPFANGTVPPESIKAFRAIGAWMKTNSESIYGTTASPFAQLAWGRCTHKGQTLYLHVFNWPADGTLVVPLQNKLSRARLLAQPRQAVTVSASPEGVRLKLPAAAPDAIATVIALQIQGEPRVLASAAAVHPGPAK